MKNNKFKKILLKTIFLKNKSKTTAKKSKNFFKKKTNKLIK